MQAFMMITALAWPLIGGGLVGLIGGLLMRHGLIGTLVDVLAGVLIGYALVMGMVALGARVPSNLGPPLSLGLPVLGGLIGLMIGSRFSSR